MNIDNLNESTGTQAGQKTGGIGTIRRLPVVKNDSTASGDQVDMSMIGKLIARSVRALADSEDLRPEVLAQHKDLPRQNARFDNSTIDRIFRRMRG